MIPTSKVLWGEGLFIRPQHFQQQDSYHEWRLTQAMTTLHPYAWGVRSAKIDNDALKAGRLRFTELQVILPDGDMYNAPAEDLLPEPLNLNPLFIADNSLIFHAVTAAIRSHGSNLSRAQSATESMRYFQTERDTADRFTDAANASISLLGKNLRILSDRQPHHDLVSLPLLRLHRNASGGFDLDTSFIAPSTSMAASPVMQLRLRRLLDILQAKVDALHGLHREPNKNVIEFRSGDMASFWLLHTVSGAYASLTHLVRHPLLHPERLFQQMLELAGALMTFSKSFTLNDLPVYDHKDPGPTFFRLEDILRELLETVISTRHLSIALRETEQSFHQGRLDAPQINESTRFYLGVHAAMPPSELVETMPSCIKVGAPEDVADRVVAAMPCITLTHAPQVPASVPVRPGCYYFALEPRGPLYDRMLRAHAVSIYVPPSVPDAQLELIAITG